MRLKLAAFLCVIFFLSGCKNADAELRSALTLRNNIAKSEGCSFLAAITADYGEKVYTFSMECKIDKEGNMSFTVTAPATLSGITGRIDSSGGAITFDNQVLAFQAIADGQVTPVTAPWLLIKTLQSGYLRDCTKTDNGYAISIDDSYEEDALRLNVYIKNDLPSEAEIFWKSRRILTLTVDNFTYL